ncbi:MAG TPA: hypothetical protein VHW03_07095, partial [Chthoniobacterales bacterium]|nr:hypothetical protein [Chthoniobacterales bacterium]
MKLLFVGFLLGSAALVQAIEPAPKTPKKPVFDTYHGVKVEDDYQWLEKDNSAVESWSAAQNKRTRAYLDQLPDRETIVQRLTKLYDSASPNYSSMVARPGCLFALKFAPPKQQPILVRLTSADDPNSAKVVLDPNELDAKGLTEIDWFVPSLDGKKVAVSLSHGGSEDGDLHFYDVDSGKALPDTISHVQFPTAGGSAAWNADGSGVYYTRFPRKGERPAADLDFYQQIYFHKLGTPDSQDTYSLGKDFPRIAEILLSSSHDGRYVLAVVSNGDGGDYDHYLHAPDGKWHQLTKFSDQIKQAALGRDDALYLISRADAPRGKVLRLPLDHLDLSAAKVIVPPSEAVVEELEPASDALYVGDLLGGPSQIRRFDLDGRNEKTIKIPPISAVREMVALDDGSLLFKDVSYIAPNVWYHYGAASEEPVATALRETSPVSFDDIEVVREFATSKDGTKIPLNIMRRKGTKLDGNNPTLLYGYGGYGISMTPSFDFTHRLWFDRGGVYV